jgi:hypothetical protein
LALGALVAWAESSLDLDFFTILDLTVLAEGIGKEEERL